MLCVGKTCSRVWYVIKCLFFGYITKYMEMCYLSAYMGSGLKNGVSQNNNY